MKMKDEENKNIKNESEEKDYSIEARISSNEWENVEEDMEKENNKN